MIVNGILVVLDIIWMASIGSVWTTELPENQAWNRLHGVHVFAIILSTFSCLIKVIKKQFLK